MTSTTAQVDRAYGVLLGTAAGDALGAPYEFQPARGPEKTVAMVGGGAFGWEPGEWTDDTSMAIAIAEVAAAGADLRDESAQDAIVERWYGWSRASKDVGIQTRSVLDYVGTQRGWSLPARYAALQMHERSGRTGGNGALMRTAPVALAYLHDEDALVTAAREISALTHYEPDAGEACVLWCCAIRHAVLTGELDVRVGLSHLDAKSRDTWSHRLAEAEASSPAEIENNGWVVAALQAAWCAIHTTNTAQGPPAEHLTRGLDAAVRAGDDTDTVAAIAGGLLGAAYGASAVPSAWRRLLHGWPGLRARDLVALTNRIIRADCDFPRPEGPVIVKRHPYDDDVRLIDREGAEANQNLDFVLSDTVDLIDRLRREGRIVLVHCHGAHSRTPTVGALYGTRVGTVSADEALADVLSTLPTANPNPGFRAALKRLAPRGLPR
ncbi:ribosylglycohydrolase [Mycobacterium antarcticum]|uniref:ADP-ribosylglycohydrolase family protein n=1 Tax=Mycolicibacterium sp. TUM20985 TaxID=3023370 RepID=UPI002573275D|nr:ADP-ribosylglycohydrolase family protein [Mycolicibacterium sp. TUM20985]BDX30388.1 ribosylglycohydrolase [Mycolicibacterium sp. TUM20985]